MPPTSNHECVDPPCIHVVADYTAKKFAVFLETSDGILVYIPFEKLEEAYKQASHLVSRRFREAQGGEIDYIAAEYLDAEALEE